MKFASDPELKTYLSGLSKSGLAEFNAPIYRTEKPIIGVPIPVLRGIAKQCAKDHKGFMQILSDDTFEEIMLYGMVIGYANIDFDEAISYLDLYIKKADSWAYIDCAIPCYRFIPKNIYEFARIIDDRAHLGAEFEKRMALVALKTYYVSKDFLDFIFKTVDNCDCSAYYVSMAAAWLISECFIKFPEETEKYIARCSLDAVTLNKVIGKICDSHRVDKQTKDRIKSYKIKNRKPLLTPNTVKD